MVHIIAPGLSGGAGEVNCAIACPRAQFLLERAVHLCLPFPASAIPTQQEGDKRVKFPLFLHSAHCLRQKLLPLRQPWEPFWYFYKLIELRIKLVWHISPNQKAQLFRDTQL